MSSHEGGRGLRHDVQAAGLRRATEWLVRAQDGQAAAVLAEIEAALREERLESVVLVRARYAQAISMSMLGRGADAVRVGRELVDVCRELGMVAFGIKGRSLLVELLRREGLRAEAAEQLARAAAMEPLLQDLHDPEVQTALGALAVALRLSGVTEEAGRVEARLAVVEEELPTHQRVSRWSNLAFEHATTGLAAARRTPYEADLVLLNRAVAEINRARELAGWSSYDIVTAEATILGAVHEAFLGDPEAGLRHLTGAAAVLERGPEAITAQLFWAAGMVRALVRLGRTAEARRIGRQILAAVQGSGREGDREILAYEVLRAEHPDVEFPGTGAAEFIELAERRLSNNAALVGALFRARVDLLRGADERRVLARAASLDSLTTLVNRRGAEAAIAGAAGLPPGEPVALLLIDLDGFKEVNDTRGHLAGDLVLKQVSAALRTAARLEDVVARWGGDEFVVVATLEHERAMALADRLRDTIRECDVRGATARITGSIGVVVRDAPIDDDTWLRRADEAMYAAKRSGGDATVLG
jgi:diguanylate cyclase (GGDEF)-like protein